MAANNSAALNRSIARSLADLPGRDTLRALITARFKSIGRFALEVGVYREQVQMCLSGAREYPAIRDLIAEKCDLTRAEVNRLLEPATKND